MMMKIEYLPKDIQEARVHVFSIGIEPYLQNTYIVLHVLCKSKIPIYFLIGRNDEYYSSKTLLFHIIKLLNNIKKTA